MLLYFFHPCSSNPASCVFAVQAQSFIRILSNENPLDERVVDQPALLRQYKDLLKSHLRTAYTNGCAALGDIMPDSLQSSADRANLASELQNMYEITVEEVFSKLRMVSSICCIFADQDDFV